MGYLSSCNFEETCFSDGPGLQYKRLMSFWDGGAYITWRWSSITDVVRSLLRRRGALSLGFDSRKFGCGQEAGEPDGDGRERKGRFQLEVKFVNTIDGIVKDQMFWAYAELVDALGGTLEQQSSYCEGCPCHGHIASSSSSWKKRSRAISRCLQHDAGKVLSACS